VSAFPLARVVMSESSRTIGPPAAAGALIGINMVERKRHHVA
jgi:hypothetical protein